MAGLSVIRLAQRAFGSTPFHSALRVLDLLYKLATLDIASLSKLKHRIDSVCSSVEENLRRESEGLDEAAERHQDVRPPPLNVQAWTNLTVFDVIPMGIQCISSDYLWYCWKRGVALQMQHNQSSFL